MLVNQSWDQMPLSLFDCITITWVLIPFVLWFYEHFDSIVVIIEISYPPP